MSLYSPAGVVRACLRACTSAAALAVVTSATWLATAQAAVPTPLVTGPIPATVAPGNALRDYPWLATMHNLGNVGFIEKSISTKARRAASTPRGRWGQPAPS